ncbi:MAG: endo-1,4-beta-xylanase [Acetatifactor sp.]|nr:endo-1,4-beta-xylanase [Acetatifactor sp.]
MFYGKIRTLTAIGATVLCMSLAGCGGNGTGTENGAEQSTVQTDVVESAEADNTKGQEGDATAQTSSDDGQTSSSEAQPDDRNNNALETAEDVALKDACNNYFMLGVGINGSTLENLTTYDEDYMAMVKKHFNSVTLSNLMKSCYILQQKASQESVDGMPVLDFKTIDDTLQWCMDNGIKMRGHTLVWHTQAPEWFFREGYRDDGKYVDKETMLARMESYIKQMLEHVQTNYPGVIYCWDVVNEAVDPGSGDKESGFLCRTEFDGGPNPWYETIGPEYVEAAFRLARQYADPDVKLIYNDFNTYETIKRNAIYALCEDLKAKGLIDGIGMQGYWGIDYPNITAITSAITIYSRLDLEIQITELSVGVDEETPEEFEKQAKRYRNIFLNLKALDTQGGGNCNITSVTFFGLKDHYNSGDKTNARLFDKDLNPKPAFDAVLQIFQMLYKD